MADQLHPVVAEAPLLPVRVNLDKTSVGRLWVNLNRFIAAEGGKGFAFVSGAGDGELDGVDRQRIVLVHICTVHKSVSDQSSCVPQACASSAH